MIPAIVKKISMKLLLNIILLFAVRLSYILNDLTYKISDTTMSLALHFYPDSVLLSQELASRSRKQGGWGIGDFD